MDAMDAQPRKYQSTSEASGSAWAELDETFFRIVADLFSHSFCSGAGTLLASHDEDASEEPVDDRPAVIVIPEARLSHTEALALINQEIDRELALRRSMRNHPSRRRF